MKLIVGKVKKLTMENRRECGCCGDIKKVGRAKLKSKFYDRIIGNKQSKNDQSNQCHIRDNGLKYIAV